MKNFGSSVRQQSAQENRWSTHGKIPAVESFPQARHRSMGATPALVQVVAEGSALRPVLLSVHTFDTFLGKAPQHATSITPIKATEMFNQRQSSQLLKMTSKSWESR
jgi:galactitol-specific phosphotransferase system IIC component